MARFSSEAANKVVPSRLAAASLAGRRGGSRCLVSPPVHEVAVEDVGHALRAQRGGGGGGGGGDGGGTIIIISIIVVIIIIIIIIISSSSNT